MFTLCELLYTVLLLLRTGAYYCLVLRLPSLSLSDFLSYYYVLFLLSTLCVVSSRANMLSCFCLAYVLCLLVLICYLAFV
jgi:hypothetical protein